MLPLPTPADVAAFSGRPESSYTSYINSAILQSALQMTVQTQLTPDDWPNLGQFTDGLLSTADAQTLATQGIIAMADHIYLRFPYQQVIASPLMNETIGSYSYGKAEGEVARNAAALEVTGERTNVDLYDMAVQVLSKRSLQGGVYSSGITVFENASGRYDGAQLEIRACDGRLMLIGPSQVNQGNNIFGEGDWNTGFGADGNLEPVFVSGSIDTPFDINGQGFPSDPGI